MTRPSAPKKPPAGVANLLVDARDALFDPVHWIGPPNAEQSLFDRRSGDDYVCCVDGAVALVAENKRVAERTSSSARKLLARVCGGDSWVFNDAEGTTHLDVVNALDATARLAFGELEVPALEGVESARVWLRDWRARHEAELAAKAATEAAEADARRRALDAEWQAARAKREARFAPRGAPLVVGARVEAYSGPHVEARLGAGVAERVGLTSGHTGEITHAWPGWVRVIWDDGGVFEGDCLLVRMLSEEAA